MKNLKYTTKEMLERFVKRQGSITEAIEEANCKRRIQNFESEGFKKWAEVEKALISINK